jgi:hypothetical protein
MRFTFVMGWNQCWLVREKVACGILSHFSISVDKWDIGRKRDVGGGMHVGPYDVTPGLACFLPQLRDRWGEVAEFLIDDRSRRITQSGACGQEDDRDAHHRS